MTSEQTSTTPLSPDAQAIKDGFDHLGGSNDPRSGFGRIPQMTSEQTSTSLLSPDAQAIKDGFDHLGASNDPRSGFGRIPQSPLPDSKGDLNTGVDKPNTGSAENPQPIAVLPSGPMTPSPTSEPSRDPVIIPPNSAIPLTPDGQAIKEGFDHLGTAGDPRSGLGKIPNPPDATLPTNHATAPSATQPIEAVRSSDSKNEPSVAVYPKTAPLTPEGQAIKDGFDHLGTAGDPRTGLGKIPNLPDSTQPTNHATAPSATQPIEAVRPSDSKNEPSVAVDPKKAPLTPDGQAIKDGFDHLGTAGDPRSGLGKIPNPPDSTQPTNHATAPSATQPIEAVRPSDSKNEPSVAVDPKTAPLTPDGQAIKDGFDHLGTAGDPRTGLGKIHNPPDSTLPTNHATQPVEAVRPSDPNNEPSVAVDPKAAPLTPDGQAIKDGFDHLGTAHDPRTGLGSIPPLPSSAVVANPNIPPQPLNDST